MVWSLIVVFLTVEYYSFCAVRKLINKPFVLKVYIITFATLLGCILYCFLQYNHTVGQTHQSRFATGLILLIFLPKITIALFLILEDIVRVFSGSIKRLLNRGDNSAPFLPSRRKFVAQLALGIAAIPFISVLYGITVGKYKFQIHKTTLFFDDLPTAFDGFKITQLSDIHSGSFDNKEKIKSAIDLINQQDSDLILFTGDIVNSLASEMIPWISVFRGIRHHKYGKYSILGNHDYGEYVDWDSEKDKEKNFQDIKDLHRKIDFRLLLNEHIWLRKDQEKIAIVGVENWGTIFGKLGDLDKSTKGVEAGDFKILMSHDPSHWEAQVLGHLKNFNLTLSGHTHGLQFGIEIPGYLKWSPAQYVYKQWAGLYEKMGRFLYVNRGFGYHAFPGRVGIWPEITVIELRKK